MKKGLSAIAMVLAMAAVASSSALGHERGGGSTEAEQGTTADRPHGQQVHQFRGKVVSVDTTAGTVNVALKPKQRRKCRKPRPPRQPEDGEPGEGQPEGSSDEGNRPPKGDRPGRLARRHARRCHRRRSARRTRRTGHEPSQRVVTVSTDEDTQVRRNGAEVMLGDLKENDRALIVIVTDEPTGPKEALRQPADVISAHSADQPPKPPSGESGE